MDRGGGVGVCCDPGRQLGEEEDERLDGALAMD